MLRGLEDLVYKMYIEKLRNNLFRDSFTRWKHTELNFDGFWLLWFVSEEYFWGTMI